ncbi:hypothetical protein GK047_21205 [Paenibacillus sp. SYP-B3998]|uniref:Uncharacterized protein n=1 Tax=Paenibacillus sp. SYP-B3998 TaxID=2678564 RepID=A0A6G4A2G7_9BACL|nr:hypothetical protein [Paenibacillus sp. SYP-B3998]NEW08520.1 hypothetical protein [Paenibacillus sp. SYP-B3998]
MANRKSIQISLIQFLEMELNVMNVALDIVDQLIRKVLFCKRIRPKDVSAVINLRILVNSFTKTIANQTTTGK